MAVLSFEKKYRVRGGTLVGGDLFDFWVGPFYVGLFGVTTIFFSLLGTALILVAAAGGGTFNPWRINIAPPDIAYGLRLAPMALGGYWQVITICALGAFGSWALRQAEIARKLGMGMHIPVAYAVAVFAFFTLNVIRPVLMGAIWLFLVLGFIRPIMMGSWSEAVPFGIFSHLDWTAAFSIRYGNLFYNPFHALSIVFLYGSVLIFAMHGATILAVGRFGGEREVEHTIDRGTAAERAGLFWRWTMGFNATYESIHRWAWWFAILTPVTGGIGILLTGTLVDNWYLWAMDRGFVASYPPYDTVNPYLQGAPR